MCVAERPALTQLRTLLEGAASLLGVTLNAKRKQPRSLTPRSRGGDTQHALLLPLHHPHLQSPCLLRVGPSASRCQAHFQSGEGDGAPCLPLQVDFLSSVLSDYITGGAAVPTTQ